MTKFDASWVKAEEAKRKRMAENGMYSEAEEHASCGVGLVVSYLSPAPEFIVDKWTVTMVTVIR